MSASKLVSGNAAAVARSKRKRELLVERRATAREIIGRLAPGHGLTMLTFGQCSLIDVIEHLVDLAAPCRIDVSTWTGNLSEYERLGRRKLAGDVTAARWLLDRSSYTREPEACEYLVGLFGRESIRTTRNHCKVVVVRGEGGDFAVRSSMNLNMNPRIENADVDHDPELCEFLERFFDYCFEALDPTDWRGVLPGGDVPVEINPLSADAGDQVLAGMI